MAIFVNHAVQQSICTKLSRTRFKIQYYFTVGPAPCDKKCQSEQQTLFSPFVRPGSKTNLNSTTQPKLHAKLLNAIAPK